MLHNSTDAFYQLIYTKEFFGWKKPVHMPHNCFWNDSSQSMSCLDPLCENIPYVGGRIHIIHHRIQMKTSFIYIWSHTHTHTPLKQKSDFHDKLFIMGKSSHRLDSTAWKSDREFFTLNRINSTLWAT